MQNEPWAEERMVADKARTELWKQEVDKHEGARTGCTSPQG